MLLRAQPRIGLCHSPRLGRSGDQCPSAWSRGDPDRPISIEFSRIGNDLILEVADTGDGFDPDLFPIQDRRKGSSDPPVEGCF